MLSFYFELPLLKQAQKNNEKKLKENPKYPNELFSSNLSEN